MPQTFQVLRCYKCSVFQVHQVKKSSKWECKLCNSKQSFIQSYANGSGKDCRLHCQKLNELRKDIDDMDFMKSTNQFAFNDENECSSDHPIYNSDKSRKISSTGGPMKDKNSPESKRSCIKALNQDEALQESCKESRWAKYLKNDD